MRQLAPLFGISKSAADRIIDHLGPKFALQSRKRFAKDAVLIVDGTLVPTRDHTIAERSRNHRYSTDHRVVARRPRSPTADTRAPDSSSPAVGSEARAELPAWKEEHNTSHKQVRARVEHVFARMKAWKILRDCRLKGDCVHHAMLGIARMHNLALAG